MSDVVTSPAILAAVRRGELYERAGRRESAVLNAWDEPEAIREIQEFRGREYTATREIPAVKGGRNKVADDDVSYHVVVVIREGKLVGCARYCRVWKPLRGGWVELGGFVVADGYRGTRITLSIINKIKELARKFGDRRFYAIAGVQSGSSAVLKHLGARVIATYYDPHYRQDAEVCEFLLPEWKTAQLLIAA